MENFAMIRLVVSAALVLALPFQPAQAETKSLRQDLIEVTMCPNVWSDIIAAGPQLPILRDYIQLEEGKVVVFQFLDLIGPFAKRYAFMKFADNCIVEAVILGSYDWSIANDPPEGPRSFVLHHYSAEQHKTLSMYSSEPSYDAVEKPAFEALKFQR